MRILYISTYGDSLDIAYRMQLEGNKVKAWIKDPKYNDVMDGFVEKVPAWGPALYWADFLVFDDNGCDEVWKVAHKIKPCFGGSSLAKKLENDREAAHSIMNLAGLKKIESISFNRIEQVIQHLKTHKTRHVVKPSGKQIESHHVLIGEQEDGEDLIAMLDRFKGLKIPFDKIEVEERKIGVEVGVSAWCAGKLGFVGMSNLNFEHKHLSEKEIGPLTCEAGTLMKYNHDLEHPYFLETLKKIEPLLKLNDYRGQIDLNMIAVLDDNGDPEYWPLEFTPRLGKPSVFIESELHVTPWSKLFYELACGHDPHLQVNYDWAVGVVLFSFGFPFSKEYMRVSHELPILGIKDLNHIHLWQGKQKNGQVITSANDGMTLVATGKGESIYDAKRRAYDNLADVKLYNSHHRWDISDKIEGIDMIQYGFSKEDMQVPVPE